MTLEEEIKQKKFRSEYHKLAIHLLFTGNWLDSHYNRIYKPFGISLQQYNILRILRGQKETPVTLGIILERMLDKNSNASRLVDKLKNKKLVERKENKKDRRQVDIIITEKGLQLLKEMDPIVENTEKIFNKLSEEEAKTLNHLLDKLRS